MRFQQSIFRNSRGWSRSTNATVKTRTIYNLPKNEAITLDLTSKPRPTFTISPLDKLEEPLSLVRLKKTVGNMLPEVELPEMILEIHAKTGFLDEFRHITDKKCQGY